MSIQSITPEQVSKDIDKRDLLVLRLNTMLFEQFVTFNRTEAWPIEVNNKDALYVKQAFINAGWTCIDGESQNKSKTMAPSARKWLIFSR